MLESKRIFRLKKRRIDIRDQVETVVQAGLTAQGVLTPGCRWSTLRLLGASPAAGTGTFFCRGEDGGVASVGAGLGRAEYQALRVVSLFSLLI